MNMAQRPILRCNQAVYLRLKLQCLTQHSEGLALCQYCRQMRIHFCLFVANDGYEIVIEATLLKDRKRQPTGLQVFLHVVPTNKKTQVKHIIRLDRVVLSLMPPLI